jgi:hypothetical protein
MKAVKALKRLTKIEVMLSNVIERYAPSNHGVQEVLQDAKASVVRAKEAVQASPETAKNPSVKAGDPNRRHLTAESRKKKPATAVGKVAAPAKTTTPAVAKKVAPKAVTATANAAKTSVEKTATNKPLNVVTKTRMPAVTKKTARQNAAAKKVVATEQEVKPPEHLVAAEVAVSAIR